MAIEYVYDDILQAGADYGAQALVNPVNCKGVMGAGLAAQFRRRYPAMFKEYEERCAKQWFKPGQVSMYLVPGNALPRYILCAATKDDWRQPSQRTWIESCVLNLYNLIVKYEIASIAIPALGCGEGRLSWNVVQDIIYEELKCFDNVRVLIYPPHMGVNSQRPQHELPKTMPAYPG